jgi:hypothetical protein
MSTDTARREDRAETVEREGQQLVDRARERGGEIGRQVKYEADHVVSELRTKAHEEANEQTHRAAGALRGVAQQLESMAEETSEQGKVVELARQGAGQIERLAEHLDREGMDGVVNDIKGFARRRPGVFLAAGFGLGMALGRLLRSSDMSQIRAASTEDSDDQTRTGRDAPRASAGTEIGQSLQAQPRSESPDFAIERRGAGGDAGSWDQA